MCVALDATRFMESFQTKAMGDHIVVPANVLDRWAVQYLLWKIEGLRQGIVASHTAIAQHTASWQQRTAWRAGVFGHAALRQYLDHAVQCCALRLLTLAVCHFPLFLFSVVVVVAVAYACACAYACALLPLPQVVHPVQREVPPRPRLPHARQGQDVTPWRCDGGGGGSAVTAA